MSPLLPLGGALVRAVLNIHEPPIGSNIRPGRLTERLTLQFNPDSIVLRKAASWLRDDQRDSLQATLPQFAGSQPRSLSVEVFLDAGDGRSSVEGHVTKLLNCCSPTPSSVRNKCPSPPWVTLVWGLQRTTSFVSVVGKVDATYTRFAPNGTPLRAVCTLSLDEVGGPLARQNPTSGSDGALAAHRITQGDQLPLLAYDYLGDPTQWRAIAQANNLDTAGPPENGSLMVIPELHDAQETDGDHG